MGGGRLTTEALRTRRRKEVKHGFCLKKKNDEIECREIWQYKGIMVLWVNPVNRVYKVIDGICACRICVKHGKCNDLMNNINKFFHMFY